MGTKWGEGKKRLCVACNVEFTQRGGRATCSDTCKSLYTQPRRGNKSSKGRALTPKEKVLIEGRSSKFGILHRCLQELERPYRCEGCGIGPEWLGQPMTLDIDHINGNHIDNREQNLRYLCPNCHRLQPTGRPYKNKNK